MKASTPINVGLMTTICSAIATMQLMQHCAAFVPSTSNGRSINARLSQNRLLQTERPQSPTSQLQSQLRMRMHDHQSSYQPIFSNDRISRTQTKSTTSTRAAAVGRSSVKLNLFENKDQVVDGRTKLNSSEINSAALSDKADVNAMAMDDGVQLALQRTGLWVSAAIVFGTALGQFYDVDTSGEFFAGYLLEQSLSIDNLLVFLLLFEYFQIPTEYQNRILNWGIMGAIVMRAIMIGAGAVAIHQFHAVLLVFAAILIYSSGKVLLGFGEDDDEEEDLSNNQIIKLASSLINSTDRFDGDRFFTIIDGVKTATPVFLCMVAVEISDIVFAVDSIPAVFGVTENPLVVFSSNLFAIMGLRSLYTILSKAASELKYLEPAVAVVLGFIGVKMVAEYAGYATPTEVSLGVVLTLLGAGIGASVWENNQISASEQ